MSDDYLSFEEEFHKGERQEIKKDRKIQERKDRSKHKKTDRDKHKAIDPSVLTHPQGRVLAITSEGITVDVNGSRYLCSLKGALKKQTKKQKNIVTIGDFVRIDPIDEHEATIVHVDERKSTLARVDNLTRRKSHLIAANVDQVFIVATVKDPTLKPTLIDRYIISAQKGNMHPIIVLNKTDLLEEALPEEEALYELFIKGYNNLDIPLIQTSVKTKQGLDEIETLMRGKTSVFSGQSGVGKSSILNALLDTKLRIGDIVDRTRKGSHTTTTATLHPLKEGGFCIDTPGIKSFGLWNINPEEVESYFPDIQAYRAQCRFPNCTHVHEPGCAVIEAVENEELSLLRYTSYLSLLEKDTKEEWE